MKLSLITVNYKSRQFLLELLKSIQQNLFDEENPDFLEVIIVNNDQNEKIDFKSKFSFDIKIINNPKNSGFGSANNLGSKESKGEYLLMINPDTKVTDNSILKMLSYADNNENVGAIGPKIIQSNRNAPQPWTCGKKTSIQGIVFRNTIAKPWNSKKIKKVQWVSGTALLIKKSFFEKVGGFDEKFFMYFEDQDLCLRLTSELKKEVFFFPDCSIIHYDGKSWNDNKLMQKKEFYISQVYFFQKHHSKLQLIALKSLKKFHDLLSILR